MEIRYLRPTSISQIPEDTDFRSTPRKDMYVQCGKKMNKQGLPWWLGGKESTWQCWLRQHIDSNWNDTEEISMAPAQG